MAAQAILRSEPHVKTGASLIRRPSPAVGIAALLALFAAAVIHAQRTDAFVASRDDAAIQYSKGPTTDRVAALNQKLENGSARLSWDNSTGYLKAALTALNVPVDSQVVLFSQNSSQGDLI